MVEVGWFDFVEWLVCLLYVVVIVFGVEYEV